MSTPIRTALRSRLTTAMRARDRDAVSAVRGALAAIDNAEAVPVAARPAGGSATSDDVAGAVLGVGAAEADRLVLGDAAERAVVDAEIAALDEAEQAYAAHGAEARVRSAATGASVLRSVLAEVDEAARDGRA